jgi:hypothetical protein
VQKEGIGLANTRARLQELYGNRSRFEYGNLPGGGASIRMSIPFRSALAVAPERVADHEYGLGAAHPKSGGLEDRARVPGQ